MNNLGDDLFENIFKKYFEKINYETIILNPYELNKNYNINYNIEKIILGGGEIINEYFLFPLFKYIKYNNIFEIPIYGISIGFNNLNIKYLDFLNGAIFRNKLSIIDDEQFYYENDIVFGYDINITINTPIINTIGYYLISDIDEQTFNNIKIFTNKIKDIYTINFLVFDKLSDLFIINKIIKECELVNYSIVIRNNNLDIINEIPKNQKHLCMRFHSHILCYILKLQFLSIPLTSKVKNFNKEYNIKGSLNHDELFTLLTEQNIEFKNLNFNFNTILKMLDSNNKILNKELSIWNILLEIYNNFLNLLNNKLLFDDIELNNKINYISDQIELNILNNLDTIYKYGINEKLKNIIKTYNSDNWKTQSEFLKIITNINN